MKPSTAALTLIVGFSILLNLYCLYASTNLVQNTCQKITQMNPNVKLDFCLTTLGSDPASKTKTVEGLGIILFKLSVAKAKTTIISISELQKDKRFGPYAQSCLKDCSKLYSSAIDSINQGYDAFKSKNYVTANVKVSAAATAADTCEGGFKDKAGEVSPLTKENNEFSELCSMVLAYINMFR